MSHGRSKPLLQHRLLVQSAPQQNMGVPIKCQIAELMLTVTGRLLGQQQAGPTPCCTIADAQAQCVSDLQRDDRGSHDGVHRDQVQALPRLGLAVQDGHALDFQHSMVQAVSEGVCHPFSHHDGHQHRQQHAHIIADL